MRFHVIGLRQVWDATKGDPHPRDCAPNALVERHAKVFDHEPNDLQVMGAIMAEEEVVQATVDTCDEIGRFVVDEAGWQEMTRSTTCDGEHARRHGPRSKDLLRLGAYRLAREASEAPKGSAWAPAPRHGPRLEEVASMLEEMNGGPTWIPGPETPYERPIARERPCNRPAERTAER